MFENLLQLYVFLNFFQSKETARVFNNFNNRGILWPVNFLKSIAFLRFMLWVLRSLWKVFSVFFWKSVATLLVFVSLQGYWVAFESFLTSFLRIFPNTDCLLLLQGNFKFWFAFLRGNYNNPSMLVVGFIEINCSSTAYVFFFLKTRTACFRNAFGEFLLCTFLKVNCIKFRSVFSLRGKLFDVFRRFWFWESLRLDFSFISLPYLFANLIDPYW